MYLNPTPFVGDAALPGAARVRRGREREVQLQRPDHRYPDPRDQHAYQGLTPYTLHPTPYTLHPTPYTLHHTPYTIHPTPYTLHPSGVPRP